MRGRRPKPTHLKLVQGDARNVGRKKLEEKAAREAKIPPALPMPPPELLDEAKVEWGRISSQLYDAGLLTDVDRGALAACCQAYGRWMQAERIMADLQKRDPIFQGLMIKTAKGHMVQNPLVGTANKAMSDYVRFCTEFGLTPSSRSRTTPVGDPKDDDDPAGQFFK